MSAPKLPRLHRAADERTVLAEMLDFNRAVLVSKASGLEQHQLHIALPPSDLTLAKLLFHMALVEDDWFQGDLLGKELPEPWVSADWEADGDWEMTTAAQMGGEQLFAQLEESLARSRAAVAEVTSLDQIAAKKHRDGTEVNPRWILVHMIEEYARHCGHADFIRQSVDGATGNLPTLTA